MNDEQLISLVELRSSIYDKTDKYYTNKAHVRALWKEIANEMHATVPACQKRWRYLRDYFVRQLHMMHNTTPEASSSGSTATRKKSLWALFERLQFLAPFSSTRRAARPKSEQLMYYMETSRALSSGGYQPDNPDSIQSISSGNSSSEDLNELGYVNMLQYQSIRSNFGSNDDDDDTSELPPVAMVIMNDDTEPPSSESHRDQLPGTSSATSLLDNNREPMVKGRKRKRSEMYDEILEILKTKRNEFECDEHEHFFKSLLASVRKIDDEHIMAFRTEILQIVMKYMYMSQGDNLVQTNGQHSNSDIVVIETGELHWRKNLGSF